MTTAPKILALGLALLMLGGCGKGESAKNGQTVAKVNGKEITAHQINFALSRLGPVNEAQEKEVGQKALKALVEQEVLVQKAVDTKLDRDPQVALEIENAKRQVLAQAYMRKQMQGLGKPTASEIHDFYAAHPELFERRRIYRFNELLFESKPEAVSGVQRQLSRGKSLAELAQWLQEQKVAFKTGESVKAAEELPLDQLPRLYSLKPGQIAAVPSGPAVLVLQLVDFRDQPLTEEEAKPFVERFLGNKKSVELAQAEIKKLTDAAKIEYLGAFAEKNQAAAPATSSPAAVDKTKSVGETDTGYLEKGLTGLK